MDAALPLPPLPVTAAHEAASTRRSSDSSIGAAVPALVASAAWWLGVPWIALVAAVGIPIGALFAAVVAPRMVGPDWVGATLLAALAAPLVPGALIAVGLLAGSIATAFGSVADAILGGAYFGADRPRRRRARRRPDHAAASRSSSRCWSGEPFGMSERRALGHVGALVAVTVVVGVVTIAAATGLLVPYGIGRVDPGY